MKFWIWFTIAVVAIVMIVPVIMATAWKIAGYLIIAMMIAVLIGIWKIRRASKRVF